MKGRRRRISHFFFAVISRRLRSVVTAMWFGSWTLTKQRKDAHSVWAMFTRIAGVLRESVELRRRREVRVIDVFASSGIAP